ncbi:hydrogenase expression protein HypA [Streptomyces cinnabarinus]|uniref:Hydrogenase expression protein HypA n=1 Tax=Streptomyces cinnabarinus TaxID=67287 RepID=A0ABY7KMA1_9ACTN|nr:hydrogenase expression protein HypA [Streptomyces cinnabarinus]WAZ25681.1 hydrogenase expression protein HypA [Streptomyces cinnabarinus]
MDRGEETGAHFEVVISGDGSAVIEGEPVPVAEGMTLDAAILDTLHGHARDRNAAVTADIADPSVGYVAYVEVAPDGSSRLLEERREQPEADDDTDGFTAAEDTDDADEFDATAEEPPRPAGPPLTPRPEPNPASAPHRDPTPDPAPAPAPRPRIGRRNGPRQSDDEFQAPGLLHRPLVVGPVALGVATLIIVPLVMLGGGGSGGGDDTRAAGADDVAGPSPSAETGNPAPTVSVSVSPSLSSSPGASATKPKPKPKSTRKGGSADKDTGGKVTVTVTAEPPRTTVTAKPPQDTAATAVNRLARSDPSGRHICYRVHLSGSGWQKPVCDGTLAGTTGQNKPIKAINIAVTGTGGSAANAFRHDPESTDGQGKWVEEWTAITADGRNNYIGSTKQGAPYMTGFAINIGSGRICQTAKVRGYDWGGQDCADQRPDFVFGGTLENTRWLEAVKFTV